MEFLHVADSASHLGPAWLSLLIAGIGVAAGALFVFGVPTMFRRDREPRAEPVAGADPPDNT